MSVVVKGGTVVDESGSRAADVLVDDGTIAAVGAGLRGDTTLEATG